LVVAGEHGAVERHPEDQACEVLGGQLGVVDLESAGGGELHSILVATAARPRSKPCLK
jgi:hypothetical protein